MIISQDQYSVLFQNAREVYIRIHLLNSNNKKVDSIEGVTTGGNISLDGTSSVRRTCNVSLIIKDTTFLIGNDRKIWLDKRVWIEIGLKDLFQDKIIWFDMGKYIINQPSVSYNSTENTLSFSGIDLMCLFNGSRNGTLVNKIIIDENTPIHEAIKMTVKTLGKYPNVLIESSDRVIPYKIEKQAGDSVDSLIQEIAQLYMDMEYFIDLNGNFVFQRIRNKENDVIKFDFTQMPQDLVLGYNVNYDFENVKNSILTMGKLLDDGIQIMYTSQNTNPNSPFNINSSIGLIQGSFIDEKIFTIEQAKARSDYELFKNSNLKETVNISTVPIYNIGMNELAYINKPELELEGKFLVIGANIPLNIDGDMSIELIKQYY